MVYVSGSLNLNAIPHADTKLYVRRLPHEITFVIASRSSMKAGIAMKNTTIHEPLTGT